MSGNEISLITDFTYETVTKELKKQLNNTAQGVVYIGWLLRKAKDSEIYKKKYSTMTEYGQAEFGLSQSDVSRFIAINQKYSEGGNSPRLADSFSGFGSSKLVEMLTLQDEDVQMIDRETTVAQIRELKHFEKSEESEHEHAEPVEQQFIMAFFTPSSKRPYEMCLQQYSKCMQVLQGQQDLEYKERKLQEIINPSRNSVFTGTAVFAFLKDRGIKIKKLGGNSYTDVSYLQVANLLRLLLPDGLPVPDHPDQKDNSGITEEPQKIEEETKPASADSKNSENNVDNNVDKSVKKENEKQSNPQKSKEKKQNAMSHNPDPTSAMNEPEPVQENSMHEDRNSGSLEDEKPEVIKAEDVEVIDPPVRKMQSDRIDMMRKKQKEALNHIEDMKKFTEKGNLTGIRSELQMMQIILSDWEKLQNAG